jgi:hypothetical protein
VAAAAPVLAWELSVATWMIVKGFQPSPITAGMTANNRQPAYQN